MNQRINDEAVYRTAPATPGLLIIGIHKTAYAILSRLSCIGSHIVKFSVS